MIIQICLMREFISTEDYSKLKMLLDTIQVPEMC
jgi:hypothetical protein